jgi:hypothetical protein
MRLYKDHEFEHTPTFDPYFLQKNRPLGLYAMETFLLDLQRPTRGVGRSLSAKITRNTVPRYIGEDGAPPALAFTHY